MVDPSDLEAASGFCTLVQSEDLLEYLGLPRDADPSQATRALAQRRRRLQAMQANPKYRESALAMLKSYRALERVLQHPEVHLEHQRRQREQARLPMLEFAIDSILVDGVLTPEEEAFVRRTALEMEIGLDTYQDLLQDKARARGVELPGGAHGAVPGDRAAHQEAERRLKGAEGHGWWNAAFTRMLLDTIPGGPGDVIDVYCRTALSAHTLLPERPQLAYVGVDRSAERLDAAREGLGSLSGRVRLVRGEPGQLPVEDDSADVVLAIRAMAYLDHPEVVIREAVRVLRPGGRLVAAEPDGLAESFYFEGHLGDYNAAFHRLCNHLSSAGRGRSAPHLALGPRLATLMERVGLRPAAVHVHASNTMKPRSLGRLSRRLREYPRALARAAGAGEIPDLAEIDRAVDRLLADTGADTVGMGGHVLPMFLAVGVVD